MTDISDMEKDLWERLTVENPERKIIRITGSRWGRLFLPAPEEPLDPEKRGHILPLPKDEERYTV